MERLTKDDLNKVCYDPWEICGMDKHCTKGCHEEGGCTGGCHILKIYRKLADYEDKQEQGLLISLPVRIGEVIYSVECGEIVTDSLYSVNKDNKGLWAINQYGGIIGRFGHTVFATRSEAEEALAKMGGANEDTD